MIGRLAYRATAVTSKAEEYRAKARECEEHAERTRDSFIKEQFLEAAKAWRNMAAYEEKKSRWARPPGVQGLQAATAKMLSLNLTGLDWSVGPA
jgi:hypothetical protein